MSAVSLRTILRRRAARCAGMRRLARDQQGSTIVEFGLIALPFFTLIYAIMEVSLVFFAGQLLEKATQDSARKILTFQAQNANWTEDEFRQEVCGHLVALFNCNGVLIDVRTFPTFAEIDVPDPISNGNLVDDFIFNPGTRGQIVFVRVLYQWQLLLPTQWFNPSNISGNKKLLIASLAFRNEP